MKLFAVPVLADYEFLGGNQSGGGEIRETAIVLALNEEEAKKLVLQGMEPLTNRELRQGKYSRLHPQKPTELTMDKSSFLCLFKW